MGPPSLCQFRLASPPLMLVSLGTPCLGAHVPFYTGMAGYIPAGEQAPRYVPYNWTEAADLMPGDFAAHDLWHKVDDGVAVDWCELAACSARGPTVQRDATAAAESTHALKC